MNTAISILHTNYLWGLYKLTHSGPDNLPENINFSDILISKNLNKLELSLIKMQGNAKCGCYNAFGLTSTPLINVEARLEQIQKLGYRYCALHWTVVFLCQT